MKKIALTVFCLSAILNIAVAAVEKNLIFSSDFEKKSLIADFARGTTNYMAVKGDVSKIFTPGFRKDSTGVTLDTQTSWQHANHRNFNPKQGTVSFWVAPVNWEPEEKRFFQIFFLGQNPGGFSVVIQKWHTGGIMRFVVANKFKEIGIVVVEMKNSVWQKNKWHKIDAAWDEKSMFLYIDGVRAKAAPKHWNPVVFAQKQNFPATADGASFGLNRMQGFRIKPTDKTSYDRFRIYDVKLTAEQIKEKYLNDLK